LPTLSEPSAAFIESAARVRDGAASPPGVPAAVSVRSAGKMYRIYDAPQDRLKHMLFGRMGRHYGQEFWALRGVSFDVSPGERLGIIGRNGSGKSTLLQIIAGTLAPTEGEVLLRGRVAALLELGSGFNPEFTGRENVFINGSILGLSRQQVEATFDEIVAFADIGEFIDQPVKVYSSGMFVRLAFAVTTSLRPDVLLVDEALAVGDIFFRQKCYARMNELRLQGCAVILVSHSMTDIEQFCDRALLLDRGRAMFLGTGPQAVKHYYLVEQMERAATLAPARASDARPASAGQQAGPWPPPGAFQSISGVPQISNGWARCTAVALCDGDHDPRAAFEQGETAHFFYEFELLHDIDVPIAGIVLQNERGMLAHGKGTLEYGTAVPTGVGRGARLRVAQAIRLDLGVGEYTFEVGLAALSEEHYQQAASLSHAELSSRIVRLCHVPGAGRFTVGFRQAGRPVQLLHHGVADLPGDSTVSVISPDESID
jgi:lipopolysaccharide transport system ATP-binding protein